MSEKQRDSEHQTPSISPADGSKGAQSVEALFLAALEKNDPDERRAFLDESCSDDDPRLTKNVSNQEGHHGKGAGKAHVKRTEPLDQKRRQI